MSDHFQQKLPGQFDSGNLGIFYFKRDGNINSWNGSFQNDQYRSVNLSIEVSTEQLLSADHVKNLEQFLSSYGRLKDMLKDHIYNAYQQTQFPVSADEIDKMYFLASVTLKKNNDWWVVWEPGDVKSVYNHFIRFTVRDGHIAWATL